MRESYAHVRQDTARREEPRADRLLGNIARNGSPRRPSWTRRSTTPTSPSSRRSSSARWAAPSPIAVAYCAALARSALGALPERVEVAASANIIKNVKSVVVPNTGGARGIEAAAAAGVVTGDADAKLEVLAGVTGEQIAEMRDYLATHEVSVAPSERPWIFDIQARVSGGGHEALCEIAGSHTNVIRVERDGEVLLDVPFEEAAGEQDAGTDRSCLSIEKIVEFAGAGEPGRRQAAAGPPDCLQHGHRPRGAGGRVGRQHRQRAALRVRQRRGQPRQSVGGRRLRRAHGRLRAARGHQLRQRQPGPHGERPRDRLRPGAGASPTRSLLRALVVSNLVDHPPQDRHRPALRLLRRHERGARARRPASPTSTAGARTRSRTRW